MGRAHPGFEGWAGIGGLQFGNRKIVDKMGGFLYQIVSGENMSSMSILGFSTCLHREKSGSSNVTRHSRALPGCHHGVPRRGREPMNKDSIP